MPMSDTLVKNFRTGYGLELDWKVISQDSEKMTSTIEAKLYWCSYGSQYYVNSTAPKTGAISQTTYAGGGGTKTFNEPNAGLSGNQRKLLEKYTKEIPHFEDGSLKVDFVGRFDCKITLSGTYFSSVTVSGEGIIGQMEGGGAGAMYVKTNGAYKAGAPYVKVGGVWKASKGVYVKKAGNWVLS